MIAPGSPFGQRHRALETLSAWVLALLWLLPLLYALWTAFHPAAYATRFVPDAPLTLQNFANAWQAAPSALLPQHLPAGDDDPGSPAGTGHAGRVCLCALHFRGSNVMFMLVLLQLMVMPDILIVENYQTMNLLGLRDTILSIGLPYFASAFGIFLLRQTFKTVPRELDEAATVEGPLPGRS
jgi:sn-glycerol 3-phosphate transport system permease protein